MMLAAYQINTTRKKQKNKQKIETKRNEKERDLKFCPLKPIMQFKNKKKLN